MEMKPIHSGKLRGVGYDARTRTLRVELEGGVLIDYANVGEEIWRRLATSASAWSYYRDNVEEELTGRRVPGAGAMAGTKKNPLDDLF
ncbi:KTSC domain-containing protein [Pseudazoarcus pumilus]|uniref:KTSC domain-containing protein n=1 Tax=Pseudazoarcus pumilus TaxID=2067960 RepID=A0A2I6S2T1_9RHOO|nr:KTSC domain-containing protein [Pseudazoarcus pumilus]AUN93528.1 KTSC domain-containing protein [Pseudazoarcus pumilus]